MENENNQFSGIPALGDTQGLENYMNNEAIKAVGGEAPQPEAQPAPVDNAQPNPAPAAENPAVTKADLAAIVSEISALKAQLGQKPAAQPAVRPQTGNTGYAPNVRAFINEALARGYSLDQIQSVLARTQNPAQNQLNQRIAAIENQIKQQQYAEYENKFISKMTNFGDKWGLSEQDLVNFGETALKHGINIANDVDLEAVFRAIYPEQYAIRAKRMAPTQTSQLYGGATVPETNGAQQSRIVDAYVESFLKQAMPSQYNQFNKK